MGSTWASYVRVSSSSFADLTLALEDWIILPTKSGGNLSWEKGISGQGSLSGSHTLLIDRPMSIGIPTPIEKRGGTKPTFRIPPFFLLGNPGIVIHLLKWNFKVTFLDKPWALVRKYLRLAPEELSASMMMTTQFLEGCHPYTCATSV